MFCLASEDLPGKRQFHHRAPPSRRVVLVTEPSEQRTVADVSAGLTTTIQSVPSVSVPFHVPAKPREATGAAGGERVDLGAGTEVGARSGFAFDFLDFLCFCSP